MTTHATTPPSVSLLHAGSQFLEYGLVLALTTVAIALLF
jgi:hypothetical protein